MPTTVTSARIASSGTPIAIATPHPIVAPRCSRTARSAPSSAPGASHTSRAPTISVDTETTSHHPSTLTQPQPVPYVGPVLLADLAAHARAAREHGALVAVAQIAADARRRAEDRSVRHGDQIAVDTAVDPDRPADRYDIARGAPVDPHGAVEYDDVSGGLARRDDGAARDHHMVGGGGRAPGDRSRAPAARTATRRSPRGQPVAWTSRRSSGAGSAQRRIRSCPPQEERRRSDARPRPWALRAGLGRSRRRDDGESTQERESHRIAPKRSVRTWIGAAEWEPARPVAGPTPVSPM